MAWTTMPATWKCGVVSVMTGAAADSRNKCRPAGDSSHHRGADLAPAWSALASEAFAKLNGRVESLARRGAV
jgi:hypothetical protein